VAVGERIGTNPDQSKSGDAVGFAGEQASRGVEQRVGQLGRVGHAT